MFASSNSFPFLTTEIAEAAEKTPMANPSRRRVTFKFCEEIAGIMSQSPRLSLRSLR